MRRVSLGTLSFWHAAAAGQLSKPSWPACFGWRVASSGDGLAYARDNPTTLDEVQGVPGFKSTFGSMLDNRLAKTVFDILLV
jgi:hypothetical protein